jgi:hypothetical protein
MIGRPRAAVTIRAAAAAIAASWLRIDRIRVSRTTHSANVPDTVRIGDPGKNSSPSAYPSMSPENSYVESQSSVSSGITERRNDSSEGPNRNRDTASTTRAVPATTPYRRPAGSRRANTSNTHGRSAEPSRSAALSMVSS